MHGPPPLNVVLLFLATAGVIVPIVKRLHVSPVLGFLIAGVALGPFGLGSLTTRFPVLSGFVLTDVEQIAEIGEFGVVFLLFMIGLELSFERLSRMRRLVFGLGPLQVFVSLGVLAGAAYLAGLPLKAAIVVGAALSLSSTAIVIPVLAERKRLNSGAGRTSFALLLFQDLAVAPFLFMVSALAAPGEDGVWTGLVLALAPAAAAMLAVVVVGRLVLRPLFHLVAAARATEVFVAACLLVILGTGTLTQASGLSMGLGAFVAGLLLAETEFRREIEVTVEPFQGLLLGLFFVSVGASLDLSLVAAAPVRIALLACGVIAAKALVVLVAAKVMRVPGHVGREVALLLGPGGEFAFVLVGAAADVHLIDASASRTVLVVVTLSMLALPFLARLAQAIGRRRPSEAPAVPPPEAPPLDDEVRVIIVGYGRVGRLVGEMLQVHNLPFLAIDDDAALVARERAVGTSIYWGDATRPDFLRRCGIAKAKAVVVTMDVPRSVEQVVDAARRERTDLTIVARARDSAQARKLYDLGVTDAVPETIEASLQLSEAVLVDIGVPMGIVIASIHEKRDSFRAALHTHVQEREGERERRGMPRSSKRRRPV